MTEPEAPEREVTLAEAMSIAVLFQKNGQFADAEGLYARILEAAPGHPDALHFSGVLAHQQGRSAEGVALIEQSLEVDPDQPDCFNNLGIIYKSLGRLDDAVTAYRQAIALNPAHANAHSNLGVLLKLQHRPVEAEAEYRQAIAINPDHIDAYHNLGVLLSSVGRTKEAVACYCKVTTLSPMHREARRLLAMAHCTLGEPEKAVEIFQKWLEEEPENPIAQHMLAACSNQAVPTRAADAYVEKVFDDFAASFDTKLASLSYQAPQIVAAMLADAGLAPVKALVVLDAGCGTGLCGPLIAPYARYLAGVDLSAQMLARAHERAVYDELAKAELTGYLASHPDAYDAVVSADTLVYFGELRDAVRAAAAALRPGGHLVFTVEELADAGAGEPFRIGTHGRYAHTAAYVTGVLAEAGLEPYMVRAELRMEAGAPVAGLAVRGTKPGGERHG